MTFCTFTAEMIKSLPTAAVIGGVHERPHLIKLLTNISIKNLICSLMQPLHHGRPLCHTPVFSKLQHLSIRRFVVGLSRHRQAEAPRRNGKVPKSQRILQFQQLLHGDGEHPRSRLQNKEPGMSRRARRGRNPTL